MLKTNLYSTILRKSDIKHIFALPTPEKPKLNSASKSYIIPKVDIFKDDPNFIEQESQ